MIAPVPLPDRARSLVLGDARSSWACSTSRPTPSPTAAAPSIRRAAVDARWRWKRRAPTSSTSAASRRGPAPSRSSREEMARVAPGARRRSPAGAGPISIDTYKAAVARARSTRAPPSSTTSAGWNTIPASAASSPHAACRLVLMHTRGRSRDMYEQARYDDVVRRSRRAAASVERAAVARRPRVELVIDPGLGFAKTRGAQLGGAGPARALRRARSTAPVGPSRKSFLTRPPAMPPAPNATGRTAAAVTAAVLAGAHIVRVHRVRRWSHVVRVADAIRAAVGPAQEPA